MKLDEKTIIAITDRVVDRIFDKIKLGDDCSRCHGSGADSYGRSCGVCNGTGMLPSGLGKQIRNLLEYHDDDRENRLERINKRKERTGEPALGAGKDWKRRD